MSIVEDVGGPLTERRITVGGYQPLTAGNVNPPKDVGGTFAAAITNSLKVAIPETPPIKLRRWTVFVRDTWASASTEFKRDDVRYFESSTPENKVRAEVARRLGRKIEDVVVESDGSPFIA